MIRMDTQNRTLALLATGLTQQELADLIPCSQSTINAFSKGHRGNRPSYLIGKRLDELYAERCPPKRRARTSRKPPTVPP